MAAGLKHPLELLERWPADGQQAIRVGPRKPGNVDRRAVFGGLLEQGTGEGDETSKGLRSGGGAAVGPALPDLRQSEQRIGLGILERERIRLRARADPAPERLEIRLKDVRGEDAELLERRRFLGRREVRHRR